MKKILQAIVVPSILFACSSCNDFLDTMPDNRTELNTPEKISKVLVDAYPTANWNMLAEFSSDNTDDNGSRNMELDRLSEEVYHWKDTKESGNDSPGAYWEACYKAVAVSNHALEAIEKLGDTEDLKAQKGEALLCRAYGHFMLSYIFCNAWTASNQNTALGIPYSTKPETTVNPSYERGTIGQTYEKIAKDIEEGLALVNDNNYSVPKYHFNRKAAYAFAARFYLYYGKYERAIECANVVLGDNASLVLRDWEALGKLSLNEDHQPNAYISTTEQANLLLVTSRSFWGLYNGPLTTSNRYCHNPTIAETETCSSTGVWGDCTSTLKQQPADYTSIPKVVFRKFPLYYMEYTDPVLGNGYYNIISSAFNTDETLLVRAEAYALTKQYSKAIADMQSWLNAYTTSKVQLTEENINQFYSNIAYYTPTEPTVKKELHPDFALEAGTQENLIQFILHARRITTLHEGLRWGDIKRYGIIIYRRIIEDKEITVTDELKVDDPRRAIQLPADVILAGLEANPRS